MSNDRSSRPSDSTTMGTRGIGSPFCATLWLLILHATWRLHMEVRREIVLDAPREEVWAALTEAERLEEWFANDVELDARPGGEGGFRWGDGGRRRAGAGAIGEGRGPAPRVGAAGVV